MRDEAIEFIRSNADKPFFLYYPSPIPHVAIQALQETEAYPREWIEHYLGDKGYLLHPAASSLCRDDHSSGFGDRRDRCRAGEAGIADEMIIMVSSDNATYAGGVDYEFFDSSGPLRPEGFALRGWYPSSHDRALARSGGGGIHHRPCRLPWGSADDRGADRTADRGGDGVSFAPTLLGGEQAQHDVLYWEHGPKQAVRMGRWKGVRTGLKKGDLTIQLYDLESDLAEQVDVAADHPEILARITELMDSEREPSKVFPLASIDEIVP